MRGGPAFAVAHAGRPSREEATLETRCAGWERCRSRRLEPWRRAARRGPASLVRSGSGIAALSPTAVGEYRWPDTGGIEAPAARRAERLPEDAPNILIILLDDVGFGQPDTFGGPIHTPTLSRLADQGISYNTFHTTADLLADPRGAADRAQPPARRLRHDRRARGRLGRLYRRHPAHLGHHGEGARQLRLQDRRLRQVAQHAGDRDHRDGAVHALADRRRHRLRLLLRLPRRRDLAVGAAAVSRTSTRSSRRTTRNTT